MPAPQPPPVIDFRPFLNCTPQTHPISRAFYEAIGFTLLWDGGDVCEFSTGYGAQRFLLAQHVTESLPPQGMMHYWVEDVDRWHRHLMGLDLETRFAGVKVAAPQVEPWGWRICYVWDPGGVLLHFAEPHSEKNKAFFRAAPWIDGAA